MNVDWLLYYIKELFINKFVRCYNGIIRKVMLFSQVYSKILVVKLNNVSDLLQNTIPKREE